MKSEGVEEAAWAGEPEGRGRTKDSLHIIYVPQTYVCLSDTKRSEAVLLFSAIGLGFSPFSVASPFGGITSS